MGAYNLIDLNRKPIEWNRQQGQTVSRDILPLAPLRGEREPGNEGASFPAGWAVSYGHPAAVPAIVPSEPSFCDVASARNPCQSSTFAPSKAASGTACHSADAWIYGN